jgi:hypothetical protein
MRFVSVLAAVAALWVQPALASTVLTFEGQANTIYYQPIVRDGFVIDHPGFASNPPFPATYSSHFHEIDSKHPAISAYGNGTGVLLVDGSNRAVNLSAVGGGAFTFNGFDIAQAEQAFGFSPNFGVRGYLNGAQVWSMTGALGQFATYGGLNVQVDRVAFNGVSNLYEGGFLLDNVVLNSVPGVPEPGTWAMMLIGFGLVGGAMRRRRYNPRQIGALGTQPSLGAGLSLHTLVTSTASIARKSQMRISCAASRIEAMPVTSSAEGWS